MLEIGETITLKIFVKEEDPVFEIKEYREDVFVFRNNEWFRLSLITLNRLQYEFNIEIENQGYYSSVPNQVILNAMNEKAIIETLLKLEKEQYFESIKCCRQVGDMLVELDYFKTININNLICIYS